jgi:hypothetical protein
MPCTPPRDLGVRGAGVGAGGRGRGPAAAARRGGRAPRSLVAGRVRWARWRGGWSGPAGGDAAAAELSRGRAPARARLTGRRSTRREGRSCSPCWCGAQTSGPSAGAGNGGVRASAAIGRRRAAGGVAGVSRPPSACCCSRLQPARHCSSLHGAAAPPLGAAAESCAAALTRPQPRSARTRGSAATVPAPGWRWARPSTWSAARAAPQTPARSRPCPASGLGSTLGRHRRTPVARGRGGREQFAESLRHTSSKCRVSPPGGRLPGAIAAARLSCALHCPACMRRGSSSPHSARPADGRQPRDAAHFTPHAPPTTLLLKPRAHARARARWGLDRLARAAHAPALAGGPCWPHPPSSHAPCFPLAWRTLQWRLCTAVDGPVGGAVGRR